MIKETYKSGNGKKAICICDWCGKEFERGYYSVKRNKTGHCFHSKKCFVNWNRGKNNSNFQSNKIKVKCHYCGEYKEITESEFKFSKSKRFFCNRKCVDNWRTTDNYKKSYKHLRKRIKVKCANCGKEKEVIPYMIKQNKYHYCKNDICKYEGIRKFRSGANAYSWKGGRIKRKDGYIKIYCPEHPNAMNDRYVMEHRLVMEKNIGRYLYPYEVVHHINGIRDDNRIENLELLPNQGKHNTKIQKVYQENQKLKETIRGLKIEKIKKYFIEKEMWNTIDLLAHSGEAVLTTEMQKNLIALLRRPQSLKNIITNLKI